jgi:hypothetical protein
MAEQRDVIEILGRDHRGMRDLAADRGTDD